MTGDLKESKKPYGEDQELLGKEALAACAIWFIVA
jgi:hypothetical protein